MSIVNSTKCSFENKSESVSNFTEKNSSQANTPKYLFSSLNAFKKFSSFNNSKLYFLHVNLNELRCGGQIIVKSKLNTNMRFFAILR